MQVVFYPLNFGSVNIQSAFGLFTGVEDQEGEENWVEVNISSTQVKRPADVVKTCDKESVNFAGELICDSLVFVEGILASEFNVQVFDLLVGSGGFFLAPC